MKRKVSIGTKRLLVPYELLWSVSVRCWSGLTCVLTLGTEWGTASALGLALPHPRLLDLRLPVPGPEHGTVLDLVVRHLSGYS